MLELFLAISRRGLGSSELLELSSLSSPISSCQIDYAEVYEKKPLLHPGCFASAVMPAVGVARNMQARLRRETSHNWVTDLAHCRCLRHPLQKKTAWWHWGQWQQVVNTTLKWPFKLIWHPAVMEKHSLSFGVLFLWFTCIHLREFSSTILKGVKKEILSFLSRQCVSSPLQVQTCTQLQRELYDGATMHVWSACRLFFESVKFTDELVESVATTWQPSDWIWSTK